MRRYELSEMLFEKIYRVEPYPDSVAPVTRMINITAFFPGGRGLWMENETDIIPSILVLGQDFSNEKEYFRMLAGESNDLNGSTWRNLLKLFKQADIDVKKCFFSNVFMGLRKTESMTGEFPGFKDKLFLKRSLEYLEYQIEVINPSTIITLGKYAARMLGYLSEINLNNWRNAKTFNDIDAKVKYNVRLGNTKCTCVPLVHPCMRNSNVKYRQYNNFYGNNAEINMLIDALKV